MFKKFKELLQENTLLYGTNYKINSLVKHMLNDSTNPNSKIFLKARYNYLSKYKYNKKITQGERIFLSNLLVHDYSTTIRELPHLLYHTLEANTRLQIIPEDFIFNMRNQKYGDFINIKIEQSIEVKTFISLDEKKIKDLIRQYRENNRNEKFLFSLFYKKEGDINEKESKAQLSNELNLTKDQIIIKPLLNIQEYLTDKNIEKAIEYYNISWQEHQLELNKRLKVYLNELLKLPNLNHTAHNKIINYIRFLNNLNNQKPIDKKIKYPYKDTTLFLEDKTIKDPLETDILTPEDYMSDISPWMFNENE